jgi:hypothetical protein
MTGSGPPRPFWGSGTRGGLTECGGRGDDPGTAGQAGRDRSGWCPVWDTRWQRCYRLAQNHVQAGRTLPEAAGGVVVQGRKLGRWVTAQRFGREQLLPVQQWILENTHGLQAAEEDERPVKRTQGTMWALNLTATGQFHAREGHLRVPRKHAEHVETEDGLSGRQGAADGPVVDKLGTCVRKHAAKTPRTRPNRPRPTRHALVAVAPHFAKGRTSRRAVHPVGAAGPSCRPARVVRRRHLPVWWGLPAPGLSSGARRRPPKGPGCADSPSTDENARREGI